MLDIGERAIDELLADPGVEGEQAIALEYGLSILDAGCAHRHGLRLSEPESAGSCPDLPGQGLGRALPPPGLYQRAPEASQKRLHGPVSPHVYAGVNIG